MHEEKPYKPVPDVEALQYKGTPEKPDIKIFVSHRIDLDSEIIDNPLYIPVRCGAVYDKREGVTMLGDDTGDNISEKRESFCELTVQYWAWKNVKADYYGLCHYKRFLSFSDTDYPTEWQDIVHEKKLGKATKEKYCINDPELMAEQISSYDAMIHKDFSTERYPHETVDTGRTVRQYWHDLNNLMIEYKSIEIMMDVLKELYPSYHKAANEYMDGHRFLGYNCFILKKNLFFDLCQFEFDILFEVEKKIDTTHYGETLKRSMGYLGEILYSIWVYKNLTSTEKYTYTAKQLVMFEDVNRDNLFPHFGEKTIPIVVMSSKVYAAFSAPFLQSIIECTKNSDSCYEIIYLHHEISEQDQKKLKNMARGQKNLLVKFFNPDGLINTKNFNVSHVNFAVEVYYRLFTPWILSNYKRALVFDIDIIVKEDPAKLFAVNLENYLAAGVRDVLWQGIINQYRHIYDYSVREMGLSNPYNYINTGVLLLNLEAIRERFTLNEVYSAASSQKFIYQEQDVFNILFEGKIKYVDVTWNYYVPSSSDTQNGLKAAEVEVYRDYSKKKDHVKMLHYAAQPKPWNAPEIPYGEVFWAVARRTPYYEELLARLTDAKTENNINVIRRLPEKIDDLYQKTGDLYQKTGDLYQKTGDLHQNIGDSYLKLVQLEKIIIFINKKFHYYRYKILSKVFFGRKRMHYRKKYLSLKENRKLLRSLNKKYQL